MILVLLVRVLVLWEGQHGVQHHLLSFQGFLLGIGQAYHPRVVLGFTHGFRSGFPRAIVDEANICSRYPTCAVHGSFQFHVPFGMWCIAC